MTEDLNACVIVLFTQWHLLCAVTSRECMGFFLLHRSTSRMAGVTG